MLHSHVQLVYTRKPDASNAHATSFASLHFAPRHATPCFSPPRHGRSGRRVCRSPSGCFEVVLSYPFLACWRGGNVRRQRGRQRQHVASEKPTAMTTESRTRHIDADCLAGNTRPALSFGLATCLPRAISALWAVGGLMGADSYRSCMYTD